MLVLGTDDVTLLVVENAKNVMLTQSMVIEETWGSYFGCSAPRILSKLHVKVQISDDCCQVQEFVLFPSDAETVIRNYVLSKKEEQDKTDQILDMWKGCVEKIATMAASNETHEHSAEDENTDSDSESTDAEHTPKWCEENDASRKEHSEAPAIVKVGPKDNKCCECGDGCCDNDSDDSASEDDDQASTDSE